MTKREKELEDALVKIYKIVMRERKPLQSPSVLNMIDDIRRIIVKAKKVGE